jgi:hypothetical protein
MASIKTNKKIYLAQKGGICVTRGAKLNVKQCTHVGCTSYARKGGVCVTHGAKLKRCSIKGCAKQAQKRGVCSSHSSKNITATNNPAPQEAKIAVPPAFPPLQIYEDEEELTSWIWRSSLMSRKLA